MNGEDGIQEKNGSISIKSGYNELKVSQIYGLSLVDDQTRSEQWLQSKEACRRFVNDLFNCTVLDSNTNSRTFCVDNRDEYKFKDHNRLIHSAGFGFNNRMYKQDVRLVTEHYDLFNLPSIYAASSNGEENDRKNFYGRAMDDIKVKTSDGYFYYTLNFIYKDKIGGTSLAQCKGKFIERMGTYNNSSTIQLTDDAGRAGSNLGNGSTTHNDDTDTYTYTETDPATTIHVIQYIYVGNNDKFDDILHKNGTGLYIKSNN